jgi:hypothetical protein
MVTRTENLLIKSLREMHTLKLITIPCTWWKKRPFISDKIWSKTPVKFLVMNAGLGNRINKYKEFGLYIEHERVVFAQFATIEQMMQYT